MTPKNPFERCAPALYFTALPYTMGEGRIKDPSDQVEEVELKCKR